MSCTWVSIELQLCAEEYQSYWNYKSNTNLRHGGPQKERDHQLLYPTRDGAWHRRARLFTLNGLVYCQGLGNLQPSHMGCDNTVQFNTVVITLFRGHHIRVYRVEKRKYRECIQNFVGILCSSMLQRMASPSTGASQTMAGKNVEWYVVVGRGLIWPLAGLYLCLYTLLAAMHVHHTPLCQSFLFFSFLFFFLCVYNNLRWIEGCTMRGIIVSP